MSKYPKVNYIGNKEKLVDWIIESFPIKKGIVLDLFCGACSVSYKLKEKGFQVITNDALYSNYCISKALIENSETLLELNLNESNLEEYFQENIYQSIKFLENKLYFSYEVLELASLIGFSEKLDESQKFIFLSLLRRAMIRKIPYSRMNIKWEEIIKLRDEEFSYLKYKRRRAYHNKTFLYHIYDNLKNYNNAIFDNNYKNKSYQKDALELLKEMREKVDLIYIDPPYPSTMNRYDEFYGPFDQLFQKNIEYTDFTNKNTFLEHIKKIVEISKNKTKYIAISLNNKSKPSYLEIKESLSDIIKNIEIKKKDHIYKVTGKENKNTTYEILMIMEV